MENFAKLIEKLSKKTLGKQAIWNKTSRESQFELELTVGAILIDVWNTSSDNYAGLIIMNEDGIAIEDVKVIANKSTDYALVVDLYNIVKRQYYDVDGVLQNIFTELDNEDIVGKAIDDDGLPF